MCAPGRASGKARTAGTGAPGTDSSGGPSPDIRARLPRRARRSRRGAGAPRDRSLDRCKREAGNTGGPGALGPQWSPYLTGRTRSALSNTRQKRGAARRLSWGRRRCPPAGEREAGSGGGAGRRNKKFRGSRGPRPSALYGPPARVRRARDLGCKRARRDVSAEAPPLPRGLVWVSRGSAPVSELGSGPRVDLCKWVCDVGAAQPVPLARGRLGGLLLPGGLCPGPAPVGPQPRAAASPAPRRPGTGGRAAASGRCGLPSEALAERTPRRRAGLARPRRHD